MKTYLIKGPVREIKVRLVSTGWRLNGKAWLKRNAVANFVFDMLCIQKLPRR